jgi:outer membrane protein
LSYALGLSLYIPIYNKNSVNFAVKQAKLNVHLAELNKKQAELDLYNKIKQAYAKALNAEENYKTAKVQLDAAQKSLSYNTERVNGGLASQLELNMAKNNLLSAQSRLTQAKYEYIFNSKVLDFYQGKPITLE